MNPHHAILTAIVFAVAGPVIACCAPNFETEVAPLLIKRCVECHQGQEPSGGLSLTSMKGFDGGGDSGDAVGTHILERITDGDMPPEKQGKSQALPDSEIEILRQWVDAGAYWPTDRKLDYFERTNDIRSGRDWWSLQPVGKPEVPRLTTSEQPVNPIDAFIQNRLYAEGFSPAPPADRRTLIRRLYYVLIGLPPSEEEVLAFKNDTSPAAWTTLVDRLLNMPQYGERQARHWLDLARYADTSGYERDQEKPNAWKYRDWVVDAFNSDRPYDQFIIEQLAGDELPNRDEASVIATGFLCLGTWNDEPNDANEYQYERLEDLVHTTSSAFIALTVKCARCHAHKFDAVTQEDYYRMASAFWSGPLSMRDRKWLGSSTPEELAYDDVLGWTDLSANPKPLHLLKDGEVHLPQAVVKPASFSFIPKLEEDFYPPPAGAKTTHRRLQLARWIADPENPLTFRVFVNRLWQHDFGKAIVRTPNNFGFLADPPTHPELLDWLATEFREENYQIKPMHRLILNSQTWRQASIHPDGKNLSISDSGNRLWWRAERRRLDAETLRDSLLSASGELDLTVGGESFKPSITPEALEGLSKKSSAWQASPPADQKRRSLYMYLKRGLLPPMMTTFDLADPTQSCGKRDITVVPNQALALMNNQFVIERSKQLASSIIRATPNDLEAQIKTAWAKVLMRQPTSGELQQALAHVTTQNKAFSKPSLSAVTSASAQAALLMHLRADQAVATKDTPPRVKAIPDLSGRSHSASQTDANARPVLKIDGFGGQPTLFFNGKNQFMHLSSQLLQTPQCTIVCVVNDLGNPGHREVISNWSGADGNSTTSLFLGLTAQTTVRFTNKFGRAGDVTNRNTPFVFTAVNGSVEAAVFQNGKLLNSGSSLGNRRLDTPWVIGQQGNINGEFWNGGIAEIRVYDRALSGPERHQVEKQVASRYHIALEIDNPLEPSAMDLALASLCQVLMNSNEFLYID